jgi:spore coat protein A
VPPPPRAAELAHRRIDMREYDDGAGRLLLLLEGKRCDDPITITPRLHSTEIWEFINTTPDVHPMHVHLVTFETEGDRPFDVDAYLATGELVYTGALRPPAAHEAGPRDVVKVPPGSATRVRMTFDRAGLYMFHCHILEHEDYDMMRFYRVVASEEQLAADARLADSQARAEALLSGRASRGGAHRHPLAHPRSSTRAHTVSV